MLKVRFGPGLNPALLIKTFIGLQSCSKVLLKAMLKARKPEKLHTERLLLLQMVGKGSSLPKKYCCLPINGGNVDNNL